MNKKSDILYILILFYFYFQLLIMSWKFNTSGGGIVEGGDGPCSSRDALGAAVSSHNGSYSYNRTSTPPRWSDINARVKEMRQTYSQLFVKTPTNIKFRLISDDCLRIYFLLCPAQGREATLFYADLNLMTVSIIVMILLSSFCYY